ncbi:stage III sporulation protein AF [Brevibacillus dissolubilis]|uniref:stage III sporulation protein AF n=1 Tax=Brevibacillus dissolubilis TaxID=1844116 RepID=UPI001117AC06|nr:stage III sporulation protein AF [Brevibacillus dissolubilis]
MEWLILWLKKIILLVLLAAFLDLILPNTSLQRYVKMVMGLIILLTIISPAFAVFSISPDEMAAKISQYQFDDSSVKQPEPFKWNDLANRLIAQQDTQMNDYVTRQMEKELRVMVQQNFGVELADVQISLNQPKEGVPPDPGQNPIQAITLTVSPQDEAATTTQESTQAPIKPIEPVTIEINPDSSSTDKEPKAIPAQTQPTDPLHRQIADHIAREWQLSPSQIRVTHDDGSMARQ